VGETHLAWFWDVTAADQTASETVMVGRTESAGRHQRPAADQRSGDGMDFGRLDSLFHRKGRQMVGSRLVSMDLPEPGGPTKRMLWPPAAPISNALLAFS